MAQDYPRELDKPPMVSEKALMVRRRDLIPYCCADIVVWRSERPVER